MQNPLSTMWIGKCSVQEYKNVVDPITKQTTRKLVPVFQDEPCRLSYSNEPITNLETGLAEVVQITKLFIKPDISISAGSIIQVEQNGVTNKYEKSGHPATYTYHQEIVLQLKRDA